MGNFCVCLLQFTKHNSPYCLVWVTQNLFYEAWKDFPKKNKLQYRERVKIHVIQDKCPEPFLFISIILTFEGRVAHPLKLELTKSCSIAIGKGAYVRFSPHSKGEIFNGNLEAIRDWGRRTGKVTWGVCAVFLWHWMEMGSGDRQWHREQSRNYVSLG